MGISDTINVKKPLICPDSGSEEFSLQTKHFDSCMAHFKIGSVLSGSPMLIGIIKETLWCGACHKATRLHSIRRPPNGSTIIGGGEDSILRVWDGTSAKEDAVFGPAKHHRIQ